MGKTRAFGPARYMGPGKYFSLEGEQWVKESVWAEAELLQELKIVYSVRNPLAGGI